MNRKQFKNKLPAIIGIILVVITIALFVIAILNDKAHKSENKLLRDKVNQLEQEKINAINSSIKLFQDSIQTLHANDVRRNKTIDSLLIAISKKEKQIIIKDNEIDNMHNAELVHELRSIFTSNNIK